MLLSFPNYLQLILVLMLPVVSLLAAPVEPPAPFGDPRSAMYSIEDICQRLKSGETGELRGFGSPLSGPQELSERCTLNDVMAVAPKKNNESGAQPNEVLSGKAYWGLRGEQWGTQVGTMPNQGAQTYVPSLVDQPISAGYHNGLGIVQGDADLIAENLKSGIDIFGVVGSYNPQVSTGDVTSAEVLEGKTFSNAQGTDFTGTMPNQGGQTYVPSDQDQKIAAGYHNGLGIVKGDADLKASNILRGVELFGIAGSYEFPPSAQGTAVPAEVLEGKSFSNGDEIGLIGIMPNQGSQTYIPTTTDQKIAAGYHDGQGIVEGDVDLVSNNIKSGVTLFSVSGSPNVVDTSSGNAVAGEIVSGKKVWVAGEELTGSLSSQSLSETSTIVSAGVYGATTLEVVDPDLMSSNIKSGVTIFGVSGDSNVVDTSSGDALSSEILSGKTAWVAGVEVIGQLGAAVSPVPQTGQTTSSESGDDGDHRKGVTTSPRFTDQGNGTVIDNLTGLIWLKDANCFGMQIWSTALTSANNLSNGSCGLSDNSVVGDWRLPNLRELQSLVDYSQFSPALPLGYPFLNVQSDYYWSATAYASHASYAWIVHLYYGDVRTYDKAVTHYVWPVRGGQ